MADSRLASGSGATETEVPAESSWRRRLLAMGFGLLFLDVFVSAAAGSRLGSLPKYGAIVAFALLAVAAIGAAVHSLSAKGKRP